MRKQVLLFGLAASVAKGATSHEASISSDYDDAATGMLVGDTRPQIHPRIFNRLKGGKKSSSSSDEENVHQPSRSPTYFPTSTYYPSSTYFPSVTAFPTWKEDEEEGNDVDVSRDSSSSKSSKSGKKKSQVKPTASPTTFYPTITAYPSQTAWPTITSLPTTDTVSISRDSSSSSSKSAKASSSGSKGKKKRSPSDDSSEEIGHDPSMSPTTPVSPSPTTLPSTPSTTTDTPSRAPTLSPIIAIIPTSDSPSDSPLPLSSAPSEFPSQDSSGAPSMVQTDSPSQVLSEAPSDSLKPSNQPSPAPSPFTTELELSGIDSQYRRYFQEAADKWSTLIVGDLPGYQLTQADREFSSCPNLPDSVDDVYICAAQTVMDGPGGIIGMALPETARLVGSKVLTATGYIEVDSEDIGSLGDDLYYFLVSFLIYSFQSCSSAGSCMVSSPIFQVRSYVRVVSSSPTAGNQVFLSIF